MAPRKTGGAAAPVDDRSDPVADQLAADVDDAAERAAARAAEGVDSDEDGLDVAPAPVPDAVPEPDEAQPPPGVVIEEDLAPVHNRIDIPLEATDAEMAALKAVAAQLAAEEEGETHLDDGQIGLVNEDFVAPWFPFLGAHVLYVLTRDDAVFFGDRYAKGDTVLGLIVDVGDDERCSLRLMADSEHMPLVRGVKQMNHPGEATPDHAGAFYREKF